MLTNTIAYVSESTQRSGMGLVKTLKSMRAAWKVGHLAAMQPKEKKLPGYMSDEYIAEVRRIAEAKGLDIPANPTDW